LRNASGESDPVSAVVLAVSIVAKAATASNMSNV